MTCYGYEECIFYFFVPCDRCGPGILETARGTSEGAEHSTIRVEAGSVRICSMKRMIHLVRHGSHAEVGHFLSGRSDIGLSARGRDEAQALAAHLAERRIASIHVSPRRRTRETALPIAARTGLVPLAASPLDEIDFGRFAGARFDDLAEDPDWQRWNSDRAVARCPGGETMVEAIARAWAYIHAIPAEQTPALCITHCDIIRGLVTHALGLSLDRIFAFECEPASLTTLELDGSGTRLLALNECAARCGG
jgi:probable phosphoglycerate mutase